MIREGNRIYEYSVTGDWLLVGIVRRGIDGDFIEWLP